MQNLLYSIYLLATDVGHLHRMASTGMEKEGTEQASDGPQKECHVHCNLLPGSLTQDRCDQEVNHQDDEEDKPYR